jgi:hypothetical protein
VNSVGAGWAGWASVISRMVLMRFNGQIVRRVDDVGGFGDGDSNWWRVHGVSPLGGAVDDAGGSWWGCGASGSFSSVLELVESTWFLPFAGPVDDAGGSWWGCGASGSLSSVLGMVESTRFFPFAGPVDDGGGSWWGCGALGSLSRVGIDSRLDNLPSISFAYSSPLRCGGGGSPLGRSHDNVSWDDSFGCHWCVGEDVPTQGVDPLQGDRHWLVGFVLWFSMSSLSMIIDGGGGG